MAVIDSGELRQAFSDWMASLDPTPVKVLHLDGKVFEIAGAQAPAGQVVDGTSLVSLLRGGQGTPRPLYWHLPLYDLRWGATPCAVIRDGDWELIDYFGDWVDSQGV